MILIGSVQYAIGMQEKIDYCSYKTSEIMFGACFEDVDGGVIFETCDKVYTCKFATHNKTLKRNLSNHCGKRTDGPRFDSIYSSIPSSISKELEACRE